MAKKRTEAQDMPRPKRPRYVDGELLPDNLYPDPRKRPGYWRYVRPDGTNKIFRATFAEAKNAAIEANQLRDTPITINKAIPVRDAISTHVDRYIKWREEYDPKLKGKESWRNRCYAMRGFAKHFTETKINHLTLANLRPWWEALGYHQQHSRRAEFNKLFNYFASQGLIPRLDFNPFTTADDRPRLLEKGKPPVIRDRLDIQSFWTIYRKAEELGYLGLQIAMGISLVTTMRRADLCELRLDEHVSETHLRKTINKSEAQRDAISVVHLEFAFSHHPHLKRLIKRARELSLINQRCPYVISHTPKQRRLGKSKEHVCQVLPDRLSDMFAEVRDACHLYPAKSDTYSPPTFHEIRSLASDRYRACGHDVKAVQELMAHTDERVTRVYQAGHGIEYTPITISLTAEVLGGEF